MSGGAMRVVRGLLAAAALAWVALSWLALLALSDLPAIHFCKWPASISCDSGLPQLWTSLAWVAVVVVVGAGIDAVRVVLRDARHALRRCGFYAVGACVLFGMFVAGRFDHVFGYPKLILGTALAIGMLLTIRATITDVVGRSRVVNVATTVVGVVGVIVVLATPAWLAEAWNARCERRPVTMTSLLRASASPWQALTHPANRSRSCAGIDGGSGRAYPRGVGGAGQAAAASHDGVEESPDSTGQDAG